MAPTRNWAHQAPIRVLVRPEVSPASDGGAVAARTRLPKFRLELGWGRATCCGTSFKGVLGEAPGWLDGSRSEWRGELGATAVMAAEELGAPT
jgi:hypothetical protein